jgi:hypothetical protein
MNNKEDVPLHCPRCGNTRDLMVYPDTFECTQCNKEFEKKDLELYDDDQILSIDEKKQAAEVFEK